MTNKRNVMKKSVTLLLAFLAFATACQNEDVPFQEKTENPEIPTPAVQPTPTVGNERKSIALTKAEEELTAQNTDFAFDFFRAMEAQPFSKGQAVWSPISVSIALSMTANGAAGETLKEMTDGLGFKGFDLEQINAFNQKLLAELTTLDCTTTLAFANSLWLNLGFKPLDAFAKTLAESYDAESRQLDFSTAVPIINQWCEEKTNGCIKNLLEQLDAASKCVLLNACYFKGGWKIPFMEELTQKKTFNNGDGTTCETDFMHGDGYFRYRKNDLFACVELPYGNEAFSLQVVLPNEGTDLSACINSLNAKSWNTFLKEMTPEIVRIELPKFKIEKKELLNESLQALGIRKAFGGKSDFSRLSAEKIFINKVLQATYFCIDENGTEAAAVTGIFSDIENVGEEAQTKAIDFQANRPFLFLLTEKSTGIVLFIGKVAEIKFL